METAPRIHPTAEVSPEAIIGEGAQVWNQAQIREGARIGKDVIVSKNVYVDKNVQIGDRCKIQNNVSIYDGVTLGEGVFVGPHVCFTNDKIPRAINPNGSAKNAGDWTVSETHVGTGASIGAHSVVLPGIRIGSFAMIGAGSVVTRSVPDHGLALGNPGRLVGFVCACGERLQKTESVYVCPRCRSEYGDLGKEAAK